MSISLIIGRVVKEQIFLLGETALTDPNATPLHPVFNGCLKVLRLSDSLAIGFAGSTRRFGTLFPSFLNSPSPSAIIELAHASQAAHADFDLIVAEVGNPKLARVKPLCRASACIKCCRTHAGERYDERFKFARVVN